eukprot:383906_1
MTRCVVANIWMIWIPITINGLNIASYNTYQIFSNPIASDLIPNQLQTIIDSDIDIICLQELFSPYSTQTYISSLSSVYSYSLSSLDVRSTNDWTLPRTSCSTQQIDALTNECTVCTAIYPAPSFAPCLATHCPDVFAQLHFSECAWCLAFAPQFTQSNDIRHATSLCGNEHHFLLNQTDGTAILSKLPITNTWSLPLPSFLFFERRVNIAQINICTETQKTHSDSSDSSDSNEPIQPCTDSLIVACTHLNPTGYKDPIGTFIPTDQAQKDAELSSHIELNAYQIKYLLNNILNDEHSPWDSTDENILGIVIAGDLNIGQTWYPQNFEIFKQHGYMDYGDGICTYCLDPEADGFNVLALGDGNVNEAQFRTEANSSRDLDHVLVRQDGLVNFRKIKSEKHFERIFVDKYNISGQWIPLSDHWGVQLVLRPKERDGGSASSDDALMNDEVKHPNGALDKTVDSAENNEEWYVLAAFGLVLSVSIIGLLWIVLCVKYKNHGFGRKEITYNSLKQEQMEGIVT